MITIPSWTPRPAILALLYRRIDPGGLVRPDQVYACHAVKLSSLVCWMLPSTRRGMSVPPNRTCSVVPSSHIRNGPSCRLLEEAGGLLGRSATSECTIV